MRRSILATALLLTCAIAASAENESGLYLGVGVGQFNVKVDDLDTTDEIQATFDSDDTVFKVFGGWRFNQFIGVELDYIDLGKPEDTIEGSRVETEIHGFAPYLIGTFPLGPVELFARVGYYFYDIKIKGESIQSLDDSNEHLVYGGGVGLTFFEHLHARLEYEVIDVSEVHDANAVWLSGAWRF